MKKLWIAAFRAMDDIKETVRNAGDKLCRAVTSLTIRICDVTLTELADAKQAMDIVLPFLLSEGIMSKVNSVRKASIGVVMKLAKVSPNFGRLMSNHACFSEIILVTLVVVHFNFISIQLSNQ